MVTVFIITVFIIKIIITVKSKNSNYTIKFRKNLTLLLVFIAPACPFNLKPIMHKCICNVYL